MKRCLNRILNFLLHGINNVLLHIIGVHSMCGIVGILSKNDNIDKTILEKMNSSIVHRGPDSEGFFYDKKVGLAMRRLKIIDLETGDQPIFNENHDVAVLLNGEIYNFKELRDILQKRGHIFKSKSDTEVLVHGYEEWKIKGLLERINGMFAFCIYDQKKSQIFLARDRLGEKPLYYFNDGEFFIFSSELQALLKSGKVPIKISRPGLYCYLSLHYVPGDLCMIEKVKKLLPGYYMNFDLKEFSIKLERYWELKEKPLENKDIDFYKDKIRYLVEDSIQMRLEADVPLGIFLSGGIDSSIIVSVVKQLTPDVNTFSIGFESKNFDETEYSDLIAKRYGTNHHHFIFDSNRVKDFLPKIIEYMDEPCGDQALLPVYWLSHEARKYVKTVLGGEGGDEIFAGYSYYPNEFIGTKGKLWHFISRHLKKTPLAFENEVFDGFFNSRNLTTASGFPLISDLNLRSKLMKGYNIEKVRLNEEEYLWFKNFKDESSQIDDPLRLCQYTDIKTWLPDDLLMKFDKMAMANSLEGRAPFLDHRLVEFAYNMPSEFKIKQQTYKYILREAFRDKLPDKIFKRQKQGFNLPMSDWLKNDLAVLLHELPDINYDDGIDNEYLKVIIEEHLSGKAERGRLIYSLLVYKLWIKNLFENTYKNE